MQRYAFAALPSDHDDNGNFVRYADVQTLITGVANAHHVLDLLGVPRTEFSNKGPETLTLLGRMRLLEKAYAELLAVAQEIYDNCTSKTGEYSPCCDDYGGDAFPSLELWGRLRDAIAKAKP